MKKYLAFAAAVLLLGVLAGQAMARGGDGKGPDGSGPGRGGCPYYNTTTASPEMQKFLDATQDLRKSYSADQAELEAVMAGQNPDAKKARELAQKITDTKLAIQAKAREMKVQTGGAPGGGMMVGCGYGNAAAGCPGYGAKSGKGPAGAAKPCCQ
jgi:hypothetical protein